MSHFQIISSGNQIAYGSVFCYVFFNVSQFFLIFFCKYNYVDIKVRPFGYLLIEKCSFKSFRQQLTMYP